MNSLEFIEKEIKYEKERIKLWDNKSQTNERLQILYQIKSELEAWYVVKDMVEIKRGEILDHVLRIKKGALDHDEYRKLKKVGFK